MKSLNVNQNLVDGNIMIVEKYDKDKKPVRLNNLLFVGYGHPSLLGISRFNVNGDLEIDGYAKSLETGETHKFSAFVPSIILIEDWHKYLSVYCPTGSVEFAQDIKDQLVRDLYGIESIFVQSSTE